MNSPQPTLRGAPGLAAVALAFSALATALPVRGQTAGLPPGMAALAALTAPDVPVTGPNEQPVAPPNWTSLPALEQMKRPGNGAAQHPMLYLGEGCNTLFVVNGGRVVWSYSTGKGWEYDDAWLLGNGDVIFSRMSYAEEVTAQKKVVWHLDAPKGTEIHTLQPIGSDRVLLVENGLPPHLLVINKRTGAVEVDHVLPAPSLTDRGTVHAQFRRVRMTARGTYLVPFLEMGRVVEYDADFREVWSYNIPSPWAAVRLHNGNTLITDERDQITREVSPILRAPRQRRHDPLLARQRWKGRPVDRGHPRQARRVGPVRLEGLRARHGRSGAGRTWSPGEPRRPGALRGAAGVAVIFHLGTDVSPASAGTSPRRPSSMWDTRR